LDLILIIFLDLILNVFLELQVLKKFEVIIFFWNKKTFYNKILKWQLKKKFTRRKIEKKLEKKFSKKIRLRNAENEISTCFTCGKEDHWKKLQNGHFQSRKHYSTRWDETNCQVQCAGCNVFRYGEQYIFSERLDQKYGEDTARRLHIKAKEIIKYQTFELEDLILKYKDLFNSI